jgi:hypothetical protein
MKSLGLFIAAVCVAAIPSHVRAQAASEPQDQRLDVEVVSANPSAQTLTIRSDAGTSTMLVDAAALRSLEGLQPGNRITIMVRDAATGKSQAIAAIVNGTVGAPSTPPMATGVSTPAVAFTPRGETMPLADGSTTTVVRKETGLAVELRSFDRTARTITVRNGDRDQVFSIDEGAAVNFDELAPGQKVLLSWRFNKAAQPEAIVRIAPAGTTTSTLAATTNVPRGPIVRVSGPVEVIAADPVGRTLTIRGDRNENHTVLVSEDAALSLRELRAGDTVLLSWGDDSVVVISKK